MKKDIKRLYTNIHVDFSHVVKLNPQFSLCDILVCYPGDNRNLTSIPKDVIDNALYSLYGVPIVGEWVYKLDGTDEKTWGSHGGKIIIDDNGIHFEQTTKALGFVTKEAVDSAQWVNILEKDGVTNHSYLKLSGCILWTDRIEETKTILEHNYGQSMECEFPKGYIRDDGYFVAEEMIFSALCVLGTAEPCFESAMIGRHYALGDCSDELNSMIFAYRNFLETKKSGVDKGMEDSILSALKNFTFNNQFGDKIEKYIFIKSDDKSVDVIDREDNYLAFSIPYKEADNKSIKFDFDGKVNKSIGLVDKYENDFSVKKEIDFLSDNIGKAAVISYESKTIGDLNNTIANLTEQLNTMNAEYSKVKTKLDQYIELDNKAKAEAHKAEIDKKVSEYASKIGNYSEYLVYRSQLDYSKSVDQVDMDLLLLLGKYNKNKSANKFSYIPISICADSSYDDEDSETLRYGNLFDRFKK